MKTRVLNTLLISLLLLNASCKNDVSENKLKNKKEQSSELLGTFSFSKNGTPAFEIFDSIVNNEKVRYLKLANEMNYLIKSKEFYKYPNKEDLKGSYLIDFKKENDWLNENIAFIQGKRMTYNTSYNKLIFFSTSKNINLKNKMKKNIVADIEYLAEFSNYNASDFFKRIDKGFFVITDEINLKASQIYRTDKELIPPKSQDEAYKKTRRDKINQSIENEK